MSDILLVELDKYGIPPPPREVECGKFTRWGKNNEFFAIRLRNGSGYFFGNFKESDKGHAVFENGRQANEKELRRLQQELNSDLANTHIRVAESCRKYWNEMIPATGHPYLTKKKVESYGLRLYKDKLVIPLMDSAGKIWSLQYISPEGEKHFRTGGRKSGCFFLIGTKFENLTAIDKICVCEGYATGATIYQCTGIPTVIAFDASNLQAVTLEIRRNNQKSKIVICADNDAYGSQNTGLIKAKQAAEKIGGSIKFPTFDDISTKPTDFNDLFILEGKDAVLAQINNGSESEKITFQPQNESDLDSFQLNEYALSYYDAKRKNYFKICAPLQVVALTKELEDENAGRIVEFKPRKSKKNKQVKIYDSWLSKDGSKIHDFLYKHGLDIETDGRAKRHLNEYLNAINPDRIIYYTLKSGWHDRAFLTATEVFGLTKDEIIHIPAAEPAKIGVSGTLEEWQHNISSLCVGNSRLMLAMSAAFASIILTPCNANNFFLHFYGKSSQGKTTMLDVAASVFGSHDYTRTWRMTDNGLEGIAMAHNDLCLFLDEISECDPYKIGAMAYMLVNGSGKTRATTSGLARRVMHWTLGGVSTGEEPLADIIKATGKNPKAGQLLRILSVPAVPEGAYGLFEDIHDFPNSAEFALHFKQACEKYHGTAFRAFIQKAVSNYDSIKMIYDSEIEKAKEKFLPQGAGGQDIRAFRSFATCGVGGILATRYGVTGWDGLDIMEAIMPNFQAWLDAKDGIENQEDKQALTQIRLFFEKYGASRFQELNASNDPAYDRTPHERAGFRTQRYGEPIYYVFKSYFEEIIARGLDLNHVKNLLRDKGILEVDKDHSRFDKNVKLGGKTKRLYVINHKIYEGEEND